MPQLQAGDLEMFGEVPTTGHHSHPHLGWALYTDLCVQSAMVPISRAGLGNISGTPVFWRCSSKPSCRKEQVWSLKWNLEKLLGGASDSQSTCGTTSKSGNPFPLTLVVPTIPQGTGTQPWGRAGRAPNLGSLITELITELGRAAMETPGHLSSANR